MISSYCKEGVKAYYLAKVTSETGHFRQFHCFRLAHRLGRSQILERGLSLSMSLLYV